MGATVVLVEGYGDLRDLTAEQLHAYRIPVHAYQTLRAWQQDGDVPKQTAVLVIDQGAFEHHRDSLDPARREGLHVVVLAHAPLRVPPMQMPDAVFMKPFPIAELRQYIRRVLPGASP